MKKIAIASLLALAATTASALDLGVGVTRDYSGTDNRNSGSLTLGQNFGKTSLTGGFERFTAGNNDQDRWSLVGGYDVAKIGAITVTPKVGVAYLNNQRTVDGYAMTVGVGAGVPLNKQISLGVDVARQYGQDRVQTFDGNRVTVGVKTRF